MPASSADAAVSADVAADTHEEQSEDELFNVERVIRARGKGAKVRP